MFKHPTHHRHIDVPTHCICYKLGHPPEGCGRRHCVTRIEKKSMDEMSKEERLVQYEHWARQLGFLPPPPQPRAR